MLDNLDFDDVWYLVEVVSCRAHTADQPDLLVAKTSDGAGCC